MAPSSAPSPRTATARASAVASGGRRAKRRRIPGATRRAPASGRRSDGVPSSSSAVSVASSRNGLPPLAVMHASMRSSPGVRPVRACTSSATAARLSGPSLMSSASRQIASIAALSEHASPERRASTRTTASSSSRCARYASQRRAGASAHCTSSITSTSGRCSARPATSQVRPCLAANSGSADAGVVGPGRPSTGPASAAAPSSSATRSAAASFETARSSSWRVTP